MLARVPKQAKLASLPFSELYAFGYAGILGLSLLASLIVFVPLPYLAVILLAVLSGSFNPALLVISSALGSAIGKLIIYQACYTGQRLISEKTKSNLLAFQRIFSKYAWVAVFIAAATPIPDDIVYVPLGFSRYNRGKFFVSTLAGKTVLVGIIVYGEAFLNSAILSIFVGEGQQPTQLVWLIGIIVAALTILLTFVIAKIDWTKWIQKHLPPQADK